MTGVLRYRAPGEAHLLLVIDTGKKKSGASIWHVGTQLDGVAARPSQLLGARLVRYTDSGSVEHWHARAMASALLLQAMPYRVPGVPVVWILERPKKYTGKRAQHRDLNDLLAVIDTLRDIVGQEAVFTREPGPWKGNIPKPVHHQRVLDAGIFTFEETPIAAPFFDRIGASYQPDVADAIALGCFETGRVERGGATLRR